MNWRGGVRDGAGLLGAGAVAFRRHGPQRQWTKYLTGLRQSLDTYLTGAQAAQWAAARDRKEAVGAAFKADEQIDYASGDVVHLYGLYDALHLVSRDTWRRVLQFSQNRVNDSCKPLHLSVGGQLQGRERALAPKGL
ncbi:hypothetical protein CHLRE_12g534850v5 [Chlamydomonas reinhardtii]|uniref:Uncharacterized protein n=1 Tax=Chlamydomonas reinhardtii TaxID=3055 RepID=A0A2K3D525_CHLRE|nr:uncharacterized protein CHLRE_12g534850v5 [Chlamydomonas reinhardtii]PNW75634.1 hypothetical protein CHLRE_12g534850v5 [Chlamydomonas reinhardtii]